MVLYMKAVILAGGLGTRLRPVTYEIPKPLVPVQKKPILNHLIEWALAGGAEAVAVLAARAHQPDFERWRKAWHGELPFEKVSIFYEETPRGTFGGMELLRDWLGENTFLLTNGDDLKVLDLPAMQELHEREGGIGTVALVEVPDARSKGVPVREGNRIREFLEKPENPPSNFINAGVYLLEPEIFEHADFSKDQVSIEKDVFPKLAAAGRLYAFEMNSGRWYDCGTLENWEKAIKEW